MSTYAAVNKNNNFQQRRDTLILLKTSTN